MRSICHLQYWTAPGRLLSADGTWRHCRRNGTVLHVEITSRRLEFVGELARLVLVRDVTKRTHEVERKRRMLDALDHQLRRNTQQLHAGRHELEIIRVGLAHVLRNRLGAIGRLQTQLDRTCRDRLDAEGQQCMERLALRIRQAGRIVDDLLILAGIHRKRMARRQLDFSELASGILARFMDRGRGPQRTIETVVEPGMRAYADAGLAGLLLTMLIDNACTNVSKCEAGGIVIGAASMNGDTVFYVRDNGAGLDATQANRLFEPLNALHDRAKSGDAGLGLAIAKRVVERHGGRIWADGFKGVGATIYFTLPDQRQNLPPPCAQPSDSILPAVPSSRS
jgi:light-regulated signal transduction histidine kinase (bacteriophytochrome)